MSLATFYVSSEWAAALGEATPFDYVIIDEASQALLPMLAASTALGKKVVWIGDQKQLAPIVSINSDVVERNNWGPLVKGFDTLCSNLPMPTYMLRDTYRLTPRGASFTGIFYNHELRSVSKADLMNRNISCINPEGGPSLVSFPLPIGDKKPRLAIDKIISLIESIQKVHPEAKISVLSKFKETVRELERASIDCDTIIREHLKVDTVDRIQGQTVDYTIFLIPRDTVRYSLENTLFNVATSRARIATIIVADEHILQENMSTEVRQFFLKLNEDKAAAFSPSTAIPPAPSISLRIVGKIELPDAKGRKSQPHLLNLDKDSIFVIDINVFVNCPDILSKIAAYKAVVPTTVLEELDKLKLKGSIDQRKISSAVKSIQESFTARYSHLESGDPSCLPLGFDQRNPDCLILSIALKHKNEGRKPVLLTSDNNLRTRAMGLEIQTLSLNEFLSSRQ